MEKQTSDNNHIFIASMAEVSPKTLFGKPYSELISEGLKVFQTFSGFSSTSLFLLDTNDFTFYLKSSIPEQNKLEIKDIFHHLVENGFVAQSLTSTDIVIIDSDDPLFHSKKIIIPLIAYTGVIGIIIILANHSITLTDEIKQLLRIHANYLALIINNKDQLSEIQHLKEITDQKIAYSTKDIVKSTLELKAILDSVQTGIIIVENKTELIIEANGLAVNLIGTDKSKIIGTKPDSFFLFSDLKVGKNSVINNQEGLLKKFNGKLVPIIKSVAFITIDNQEYRIESFLDISVRKEMEYALERARFELEQKVEERTIQLFNSNKELQKEINERKKAEEDILKLYWAVEQSPFSIFITDTKGNIEYVNHCFCDITGYKYEEVLGLNPCSFCTDEATTSVLSEIWEIVLKGSEWKGEFMNKKKNGELFWVSSSISPIRNVEGEITHFLAIQEDITLKKSAQQKLLEAKKKVEESEKLKTAILANMSHELRTPIIGILGFSQILSEDLKEPIQNNMVRSIYSSGKRLKNTVDDIIFLTRFDGSDIVLKSDTVNIPELVKDLGVNYTKTAAEKNLVFNLQVQNNNLYSKLDPELFGEALFKIVDNAFKFTNIGSVSIVIDSEIKNEIKWIIIKIIDTGIGIEEKSYEIIFEAFRQQSEGFSRNYEGCGFGLTIAKKIITSMNGFITIESLINKGSTFTIWLPSAE